MSGGETSGKLRIRDYWCSDSHGQKRGEMFSYHYLLGINVSCCLAVPYSYPLRDGGSGELWARSLNWGLKVCLYKVQN